MELNVLGQRPCTFNCQIENIKSQKGYTFDLVKTRKRPCRTCRTEGVQSTPGVRVGAHNRFKPVPLFATVWQVLMWKYSQTQPIQPNSRFNQNLEGSILAWLFVVCCWDAGTIQTRTNTSQSRSDHNVANGFKWLKMAQMAANCCKWLQMAANGWAWLKMAKNGWNWL